MGFLKPLKGPVTRKPFLVLDIESKDGDSQKVGFTRPFMVGVYDGNQFFPFYDESRIANSEERYFKPGGCVDLAMRHILTPKNVGSHIYAHNAGRFDYLFLLPWLMGPGAELGFMFDVVPVASSIQILDVWRGKERKKVWRFLDSYKLIPLKLDTASKTFGMPGKLRHDLNIPESDRESWNRYNSQDCVELFNVLERFHHYIEKVLLGEVGVTTPSTAMKLFRRRYLNRPIPRSEHTHEFVREGYFGGRVEAFERYGEGLRYYDFNSSYPASMLEDMPIGNSSEWRGPPPDRFLSGRIGFVEADVFVPPDLHIPPLPVRSDGTACPKGKLIFPSGKLRGTWEWSELEMALEQGCRIDRWGSSYWFEKGPLFAEFVRDLYRYRDKSQPDYDEGLALIAKLLLNSSYGKFGQKSIRRKIYRFDDPDLPELAVPASPSPDSLIWYAEEEQDAAYIMPQIAARVTSLARQRLYRGMMKAVGLGGRIYYVDTDSIVTDVELPSSSALGELKDEYPKQSGRLIGEFLGPKLYVLTTKDGFCSVRAKGLQERTIENVRKLAVGGTVQVDRLEKVGSLARAGFSRGPRMVKVPRTLRAEAGKREVLPNGSSRPYILSMY